MSSAFISERVLDVRHWTDAYFSFTVTRDDGFRFDNGQFVMIGLMVEGQAADARLLDRQPELGGAPRVLLDQGARTVR
jgi:ferredoxin-NADP reductase